MAPLHSYRFLSVERQLLTKTLHFWGADIKYNTYCSAGGRCNRISMNSKASLSFFFNNTTKMMQQVGPFCWKFHTGGVFACVPLHATICMSDSIWVAPNETTNGVLGDLPQTSDWARGATWDWNKTSQRGSVEFPTLATWCRALTCWMMLQAA